MSRLDLDNHFEDADAFYTALTQAIDAGGDEAGRRLLCRLVLILANAVGDKNILAEAIALAAA